MALALVMSGLPVGCEVRVACSAGWSVRVSADQLVEPAGLAVGGLLLVDEGQLPVVEDPEELVPVGLGEPVVGLVELDAQYAAATGGAIRVLGSRHGRRPGAASFGPGADHVVVGGGVARRGGLALGVAGDLIDRVGFLGCRGGVAVLLVAHDDVPSCWGLGRRCRPTDSGVAMRGNGSVRQLRHLAGSGGRSRESRLVLEPSFQPKACRGGSSTPGPPPGNAG